ncbi:MAG: amidohydrolase [Dehalococcoidia bacterium]|nr:amidohydrolase [Dehalococcoidia bacterium]
MVDTNLEFIIDGDGHIMEDNAAIAKHMPPYYGTPGALDLRAMFPPIDHLHTAHFATTIGREVRGNKQVGPDEWFQFLEDVGIDQTVLYPSGGLGYGKVVNRDYAIAVCKAYNNWLYETYLQKSDRFKGVALIPMQEPDAAIEELRRAVNDLGMVGTMLPSRGLALHLGAKEYWPVYAEAERLNVSIAIHGGCHDGMGMDHLNVFEPVVALGHSFGMMIAFGAMMYNGVFDRFPGIRVAFLEGGVGWLPFCIERFERMHETRKEIAIRKEELMGPADDESIADYIRKHVKARRIFIGCEGHEPTLAHAVAEVGNEPFFFSSDFPHEVDEKFCRHEISEIREQDGLSDTDKEAILHRNAAVFYNLSVN